MKTVAKMVVLSLILGPVAFLAGCGKRCGEPVMQHRVEKMKYETGGK